MLWQYDAVLGQQTANLITDLCPASDEPASDSMKGLQVLLSTVFAGTNRICGRLTCCQIVPPRRSQPGCKRILASRQSADIAAVFIQKPHS